MQITTRYPRKLTESVSTISICYLAIFAIFERDGVRISAHLSRDLVRISAQFEWRGIESMV